MQLAYTVGQHRAPRVTGGPLRVNSVNRDISVFVVFLPKERSVSQDRIARIARERFEYESLRPGQKEAIRSVYDGRDTLAVMPTGSGKSAVYQLAGLMIPGPTVVISPLIALQQDQVENIEEQGVGEAAQVNSTVRKSEREEHSRTSKTVISSSCSSRRSSLTTKRRWSGSRTRSHLCSSSTKRTASASGGMISGRLT